MPSCMRCGKVNLPEALFCQDCGQRLAPVAETPIEKPVAVKNAAPVCPRCGTVNSPGMNFCKMCGTPLAAPPPELAEARAVGDGRSGPMSIANMGGGPSSENSPLGKLQCAVCNKQTPAGFAFCQHCGSRLSSLPLAPPRAEAGAIRTETRVEPKSGEESTGQVEGRAARGEISGPVAAAPIAPASIAPVPIAPTPSAPVALAPVPIARTPSAPVAIAPVPPVSVEPDAAPIALTRIVTTPIAAPTPMPSSTPSPIAAAPSAPPAMATTLSFPASAPSPVAGPASAAGSAAPTATSPKQTTGPAARVEAPAPAPAPIGAPVAASAASVAALTAAMPVVSLDAAATGPMPSVTQASAPTIIIAPTPSAEPRAPSLTPASFDARRAGVATPVADPRAPIAAPAKMDKSAGVPRGQPTWGRLVFVRSGGVDGETQSLFGSSFDIGRAGGNLVIASDPYLAPQHARLVSDGTSVKLRALDTTNGVYIRLRGPHAMVSGDQFLIGRQILRYETILPEEREPGSLFELGVRVMGSLSPEAWGRVRQLSTAATTRDVYHLVRPDIVFGRSKGDFLFPEDDLVSASHAAFRRAGASGRLEDLGSAAGTFVRVRGERVLQGGDVLRMGAQLIRFESVG